MERLPIIDHCALGWGLQTEKGAYTHSLYFLLDILLCHCTFLSGTPREINFGGSNGGGAYENSAEIKTQKDIRKTGKVLGGMHHTMHRLFSVCPNVSMKTSRSINISRFRFVQHFVVVLSDIRIYTCFMSNIRSIMFRVHALYTETEINRTKN